VSNEYVKVYSGSEWSPKGKSPQRERSPKGEPVLDATLPPLISRKKQNKKNVLKKKEKQDVKLWKNRELN
jgi:hypothetical protein